MTLTLGDPTTLRSYPPYWHHGLCPFHGKHKIGDADEVDEIGDAVVLVGPFPPEAKLPVFLTSCLRIILPNIDTATALVADFGIGDADGVIDTTLISGSTVGRAAGVDDLDANTADGFIDIGDKYLIWSITTAPTGVEAAAIGQYIEVVGVYVGNVFVGEVAPASN